MIALRKPSCTPRMLVTEEGHRNDDACEDDKSIFHSLALVSYRVFLNVQICPKCTLASLGAETSSCLGSTDYQSSSIQFSVLFSCYSPSQMHFCTKLHLPTDVKTKAMNTLT